MATKYDKYGLETLFTLKETLSRAEDINGVILRLRYDPSLSTVATQDPQFIADSDKNLFLSKLHWRQLELYQELLKFNWKIDYADFVSTIANYVAKHLNMQSCHELLLELSRDGKAKITAIELSPRSDLFGGVKWAEIPDCTYQIFLDQEITPKSFDTTLPRPGSRPLERAKVRLRSLVQAFARQNNNTRYDVLMISPILEIVCGIECCVAFFRNGQWTTPPTTSGARLDPLRTALISNGFLREKSVFLKDTRLYEEVLVFNAVRGIHRGIIMNTPVDVIPQRPTYRKRVRSKAARLRDERKQLLRENEARARNTSVQMGKLHETNCSNKRKRPLPGLSQFRFE